MCYIWSIALNVAETWMVRSVDQELMEVLICGAREGWKDQSV